MLYNYTYVPHEETEEFFRSIKEVSIKLWRNRNTIQNFSLTNRLFTQHQIVTLRKSPKFCALVQTFIETWLILDNPQKKLVMRAFVWENDVFKRLTNTQKPILCKNELPEAIREPSKKLFYYLYDERFRKKYLNIYYPIFYYIHRNRDCPFCGLEKIPAPNSIKKKEYDHILAKSIYPFASVNLENLAPACTHCNEDAKKDKDVVFQIDQLGIKTRREFDYVYEGAKLPINIVLGNQTTFPDSSLNPGYWDIIIFPNVPKTAAWDDIFSIKKRYAETLDEKYNDWTTQASNHCIISAAITQQQIQGAIIIYANTFYLASNENMENLLRIRFYEFIANNPNSMPFKNIQMALSF